MNWNCPHCNTNMVLTNDNTLINEVELDIPNNDGGKLLRNLFYICSNDECAKISLVSEIYNGDINHNQHNNTYYLSNSGRKHEKTWNLIPESKAKVFPDYIPSPLLEDYKEACLIKDLSPKASATLSRRCLQGIIRDFWNIKKGRLVDEIDQLEGKIDPLIYKAIDATRKIGNIGAHMEKDINLIIDVEPEEAEKLIYLIEVLFKECYITKYEREKELEAIVNTGKQKIEDKKGGKKNT